MPKNLRTIGQDDLRRDPYAVWNAFTDLLAMSDYADLSETQRPAHLVFWYESEVQNGGHLQFFLNRGTEQGPETVAALKALGAPIQASVLERALAQWASKPRRASSDLDDVIDEALEDEFEALDGAFFEAPDELTTVLERHLAQNERDFILRA